MRALFNQGPLGQACETIANSVFDQGGRALLVGGSVRDAILGHPSKDIDIEVFGIEADHLQSILEENFRITTVGRAFCVIKLKEFDIDVSLPRRESKRGKGHKGFEIVGDPHMTVEQAAKRRDYTLNAIYYDWHEDRLEDPYNGLQDLQNKVLRHVSDAFAEDPLRVLRGMQLIARFGLSVAPETLQLAQSMEAEGLPRERLFGEWSKLLLKGVSISAGLNFLNDSTWIRYFPEIQALVDCPQDPVWHPEGDVWIHTLHCLDDFAKERTGNDWEDLVVGFAVLCHDLGKPKTTYTDDNGRIRSPRHDIEGVPIAESFLRRLTDNRALIEEVLPLVEAHMRPADLYSQYQHGAQVSDSALRRLAKKVRRIDRLARVVSADMGGRPPQGKGEALTLLEKLVERAHELEVGDSAPKPIVKGRHLIALGWKPGKEFKAILDECFEAQLEGEFHDEEAGKAYLKKLTERSG